MQRLDHLHGCILGTAVGDAIGLPREGLSRRRATRLFGDPPLHHALIGHRGLCSDDTEHTVMVAQSLIATGGDPNPFARAFAKRLRWWIVRLPAGVGLGTLRACLKLWIGMGPRRSGVRSAGNGPAMRSALLGVVAETPAAVAELVRASTRITHTDPRAEQGALIIAVAAHAITRAGNTPPESGPLLEELLPLAEDTELRKHLETAAESLARGDTPQQFAERLGLDHGVGGYVNHTVPVALYCWLAHRGSFRNAVESAVARGGDTDTVAAITGALAGTELGPQSVPAEWKENLAEWPCTAGWMESLAQRLAESTANKASMSPPRLNPLLLLARNLVFIPVVLAHGFRRLLPPY